MSDDEQIATLEILERHHVQAVVLCSLFRTYGIARTEMTDREVAAIRDAWRLILDHSLWQPTVVAVRDAATVLEPFCHSVGELVDELDELASFLTQQEPVQAIARILGTGPGSVITTDEIVRRGELGIRRVTAFEVRDPGVHLTKDSAERAIQELRAMLPEPNRDYIRIAHPTGDVVAFADYVTGDYVYANKVSNETQDLGRPEPVHRSWRHGIEQLHKLAG